MSERTDLYNQDAFGSGLPSDEDSRWNREGANLQRDFQHITVVGSTPQRPGIGRTFRKRRKKQSEGTPTETHQNRSSSTTTRPAVDKGKKKKKKVPLDDPQFLFQALRYFQFASRRFAIDLIRNSRVLVNNKVQRNPNTLVTPGIDRIMVDQLTLHYRPQRAYILYYKPPHEPGSKEPGERSVHDRIPRTERWYFPVGRMTRFAQGLVILTNDPVHRNTLVTPMNYLPKEYHIKVHREPSRIELEQLEAAVRALHVANEEATVAILRTTRRHCWLSIVTYRGMVDDLTPILKRYQLEPLSIHRVRVGGLTLDGLHPGEWRRMNEIDLAKLWGINLQEASFFYRRTQLPFFRRRQGNGSAETSESTAELTTESSISDETLS